MFRRIVGALLFWGTENRLCHRPTQTWSKVNGAIFFLLLFKERVSRKCICNAFTLLITHTGAHKHVKYEKWKGLQSKILLLLCRLHKYKNAYMSWWIVIACIRIRLPHAWADRFLCGDAFSLCACKLHHVNSESVMARAQLSLKGNGRWDSDWFIVRYAQGLICTRTSRIQIRHLWNSVYIWKIIYNDHACGTSTFEIKNLSMQKPPHVNFSRHNARIQ